MVLVIGRDFLDGFNLGEAGLGVDLLVFLENDEVADEIKQGRLVEHSLDEHFKPAYVGGGFFFAVDGLPGLESAERGGEGSGLGFQSVRDDAKGVVEEQRGDDRLVGLYLVVGLSDGGVGVGRVLELDDYERQAVDVENDVGPLVLVALNDGVLVDGEEDVFFGILEIDEPDALAAILAAFAHVHGHAFGQHFVEGFVGVDELGGIDG